MNYLIMSDNHFGHNKIHEPQFGGRPIGFEELILRNIQQTVQPNDIYIDLGDVAIYQHDYWHRRLRQHCRGKMFLILGNHDKHSSSWYYDRGWDLVATSLSVNMYGYSIIFSHRPVSVTPPQVNVHGHWHNPALHPEIVSMPNHKLITIEHQYTPINLRKLLNA